MLLRTCLILFFILWQIDCVVISSKNLASIGDIPIITPTPLNQNTKCPETVKATYLANKPVNRPILTNSNINTNLNSNPYADCKYPPLVETYNISIYHRLVADAAKNPELDSLEKYPAPKFGAALIYRLDTIIPENIEDVYKLETLPPDLAKKFVAVNTKPGRLDSYEFLTTWIDPLSGDRNMVRFYAQARRRIPKARAVVAFSNIAVDETHAKALVYREYYGVDKILKKHYLLLKLRKDESNKIEDDIEGIDEIRVLEVPK